MYWLELTAPAMEHVLRAIDRVVARGIGYRHLVSATRYGTLLLLDDPEEPLPVSEMVVLRTSRHVRIWWSLSAPHEAIDLLFRCHRDEDDEVGTPAPAGQSYQSQTKEDHQEESAVQEEEEEEEEEDGRKGARLAGNW